MRFGAPGFAPLGRGSDATVFSHLIFGRFCDVDEFDEK